MLALKKVWRMKLFACLTGDYNITMEQCHDFSLFVVVYGLSRGFLRGSKQRLVCLPGFTCFDRGCYGVISEKLR